MKRKPLLLPVFLIWYTIGVILQVFFTVPEVLAFSKPLFLVFYAVSLIELIWLFEQKGRALLVGSVTVGVVTFFIEVLSVETGFPFGEYDYTSVLGPKLLGVPVTIALAWVGVLLNSLLMASQTNKWRRAVETGLWVVIIDLILDPVAIFESFWTWYNPGTLHYFNIPITNFISWFVIGAGLSLLFPLYHRPKQLHRSNVFIFQLMLLMFGLLAIKHGEMIVFGLSIFFIVLAEANYRHQFKQQRHVV